MRLAGAQPGGAERGRRTSRRQFGPSDRRVLHAGVRGLVLTADSDHADPTRRRADPAASGGFTPGAPTGTAPGAPTGTAPGGWQRSGRRLAAGRTGVGSRRTAAP